MRERYIFKNAAGADSDGILHQWGWGSPLVESVVPHGLLSGKAARLSHVNRQKLWCVQNGRMPSDFKPMPEVGAGVHEIRINVGTAQRVL